MAHAETQPAPAGRTAWVRNVAQPLRSYLETESGSAIALLGAALLALVWANGPWGHTYEELWTTELSFRLGDWVVTEDLRHWVNDGLMALFFFVLGLEIKQELVDGQLSSPRAAAVPVLGALGGMILPAAIYLGLNAGGPGAAGWGIPTATDVAFSLGVLALLVGEAKLGVIAASLVAASLGAAILLTGSRRPAPRPSSR